VQGVAEVERGGHVGGRDDDGEGGTVVGDARGVSVEGAGLVPAGADRGLGLFRAVGLREAVPAPTGPCAIPRCISGNGAGGVRSRLALRLDLRLSHRCSLTLFPLIVVTGRFGAGERSAKGRRGGLAG